VVEGSIPVKDDGIYCKIAGKTALELIKETAPGAKAIVAIGSCASWGGVQSKGPNPTGAKGVNEVINKPVINVPGCPPIPEVFLSTLLYVLTFNKLPKIDKKGRPDLGYKYTIHDHCERRAHFNAGRFALKPGDEGHRNGWCLYLMGCKGPVTHAACSAQGFNDGDVWPVSAGAPCVGCTEEEIAFEVPIHETVDVVVNDRPKILDEDQKATYPKVGEQKERGTGSLVGAGIAGAAIGTVAGFAGAIAAKLPDSTKGQEGENKNE
jgi:hydrogenase small subunit